MFRYLTVKHLTVFLAIFSFVSSVPCNTANCIDCDTVANMCFACKDNFELSILGTCHSNTIPNCIMYGTNHQCLVCGPTFIISSGKCIKDYSGCLEYNTNNGECKQCGFGKSLNNGKCVGSLFCSSYNVDSCVKCQSGYQLKNGICINTQANCLLVNKDNGVCQKCRQEYSLEGYECQNELIQNCYLSLGNVNGCFMCKNGYTFYQNKCLLSDQVEILLGRQTDDTLLREVQQTGTGDPFCQTLLNGICTICVNGYELNSNKVCQQILAIDRCLVKNPNNPNTCLICEYGWYPSGNSCLKVSQLCDQFNVADGGCFTCKYGLFLTNDRKCVDNNCNSRDSNEKCLGCITSYTLNQANVCQFRDINCIQYINSRCNNCKQGYYTTLQGNCKILPFGCRYANIVVGNCLECQTGYQFASAGVCQLIPKIDNCEIINSQNTKQCLRCITGYYPSGQKCLKVSSLCQSYDIILGSCLKCINAQYILNNGRCLDPNCDNQLADTCVTCKTYFKVSNSSLLCQFSDINCQVSTINGCTKCKAGYYLNLQKGCTLLPNNCASANVNGVCLTCSTGYNLVNATCVDPNCVQFNANGCTSCKTNYAVLSGSPLCQFNDPNCQTVGTQGCSLCKAGYYLNSQNSCSLLPSNCLTANTNGICLTCNSQSQLSNGACTIINVIANCRLSTNGICTACNNGYYLKNQVCLKFSQFCTSISAVTGRCSSCLSGYQLSNDDCIEIPTNPNPTVDQYCLKYSGSTCIQCANKYFINTNGLCTPVNPLCKESNSLGDCTACYTGYTLSIGNCIISAVANQNCKRITNSLCQECYQGYYVSAGRCVQVSGLCKTYNLTTGVCLTCYNGYSLINGDCKVSLVDANCKTFSNGVCQNCYNLYFINSAGVCTAANPLCQTYLGNGQCDSCYKGYGLQNGNCVIGVTSGNNDPNCKTVVNRVCNQCYGGYYLSNGICKNISPLCKTSNSNGQCTSCYSGYTLLNGDCVIGTPVDQFCKIQSSNPAICQQCYSGYYVTSTGKCNLLDPLCKTYNLTNGLCMSCYPGYSLTSVGTCVITTSVQPNIDDRYCVKIANGKCIQCSNGYYLGSNSVCQALNPLCKSSNMNTGACQDCYQGYVLSNGNCVIAQTVNIAYCSSYLSNGNCNDCINGYFLKSPTECSAVSILCSDYNRLTGKCTICYSGYVLENGQCIRPALGFDQYCDNYVNSYCNKCKIGYYLVNYTCSPIDNRCLNFDYQNSVCLSCASNLTPTGAYCA